jgi:hypothetical protein
MKNLMFVLLLPLFACSAGLSPEHPNPATVVDSSYRVLVKCDLSEQPTKLLTGSAVAVAPRYALTARHVVEAAYERAEVVCGGRDMFKIVLVNPAGREMEAVLDAFPKDPDWENHAWADMARLVLVGAHEFPHYVPLAKNLPNLGDQVCAYTGSVIGMAGMESWAYKCVYVSRVGSLDVAFGGKCAPGNSGGGLLNANGELVGLIIEGYMYPDQEFWLRGPNARALRELVPDELFSPDLS